MRPAVSARPARPRRLVEADALDRRSPSASARRPERPRPRAPAARAAGPAGAPLLRAQRARSSSSTWRVGSSLNGGGTCRRAGCRARHRAAAAAVWRGGCDGGGVIGADGGSVSGACATAAAAARPACAGRPLVELGLLDPRRRAPAWPGRRGAGASAPAAPRRWQRPASAGAAASAAAAAPSPAPARRVFHVHLVAAARGAAPMYTLESSSARRPPSSRSMRRMRVRSPALS